MKKISLRAFLIIILTITSLLFLSFFIFLIRDISLTYKYIDYSNEFKSAYFSWNKALNAQHEFLIKYEDDPVFFQTEQNKYLKRQQINISDAKLKFDSLQLLDLTTDIELEDDLQLFEDNLNKEEEIFNEISHLLFLRGSKKTGIIGNCFSFYDIAITSANDPRLNHYLGLMNNSFLNYLNKPKFESYEQFLDYFTLLNTYVTQQQVVRDTGIVDTTQLIPEKKEISPEFINNVNEFKQSFGKLVNLDRNLYLNDQANLMMQWSDNTSKYSEILTDSLQKINKLVDENRQNTQRQIIIFLIALFIFFVLINIFLPRIISRRIKELKTYLDPLKTGKIPEYSFEPKAFTEIIEMSDTIKKVVSSLKNASAFATEIGKGNFSYKYQPASDQDELGNALILLRDNLKKAQEDEKRRKKEDEIRQWLNTGIAKFSDLLRQSTENIEELATLIIKELVNYLNANQGGIFTINDEKKDKKTIELIASYAYSKERKKKKIFYMGEGLIGTCAIEKATIYMTEIPEDYISITSGLGGANPRSLLIVPLKFEEQVLGVIELASFNELEKYQIEFVERIAESIASTLSIAKINERTVKLLDRAKVEAEQRSLKEEELRQNLEELKATQEKAKLREEEMNNLIDLINKVAFIIELDVEGNIITIPDRLTEEFGLSNNEIIGHHISEFDYNQETKLNKPDFWQQILEGKEKKYKLQYQKDEKTIWFNQYIVPFIDKSDKVQKLICVLIDISEQIEMQEELLSQTNDLQMKEQEVLNKINELKKANKEAEKEKQAAQELTHKLKTSEQILKKALDKNKKQLKQNQDLIKKAEDQSERFKFIFNSSSDAIQILHEGKFIDCNNATLKMFKFDNKEDFTGTPPGKVSPKKQPDGKNSMEKANEMINIAIEKGQHSFKWTHKRNDGEDFPAEVTLVSYTQNEKVYIYALVNDLSTKEKLKELDKEFHDEAIKNKNKVRKYKEEIDKLYSKLDKREAEIFTLKKQIEELKDKNK